MPCFHIRAGILYFLCEPVKRLWSRGVLRGKEEIMVFIVDLSGGAMLQGVGPQNRERRSEDDSGGRGSMGKPLEDEGCEGPLGPAFAHREDVRVWSESLDVGGGRISGPLQLARR
jgi:hypothetical protein